MLEEVQTRRRSHWRAGPEHKDQLRGVEGNTHPAELRQYNMQTSFVTLLFYQFVRIH